MQLGRSIVVAPAPTGTAATDRANIQNAIDAVQVGSAGSERYGVVYLQAGTYKVDQKIVLRYGTQLIGAGAGTTIIEENIQAKTGTGDFKYGGNSKRIYIANEDLFDSLAVGDFIKADNDEFEARGQIEAKDDTNNYISLVSDYAGSSGSLDFSTISPVIEVRGIGTGSGPRHMAVKNLAITSVNQNRMHVGIDVYRTLLVDIENVNIKNMRVGIYISNGYNNLRNVAISYCRTGLHFGSYTAGGDYGDWSNGNNVFGGSIAWCTESGIRALNACGNSFFGVAVELNNGHGVYFGPGFGQNLLSGCYIEANGGVDETKHQVYFGSCGNRVEGCWVNASNNRQFFGWDPNLPANNGTILIGNGLTEDEGGAFSYDHTLPGSVGIGCMPAEFRQLTVQTGAKFAGRASFGGTTKLLNDGYSGTTYTGTAELVNYRVQIETVQTGPVTAMANHVPPDGYLTVTSAGHGLANNDVVLMDHTTYRGPYIITNVTTNTFDIASIWYTYTGPASWEKSNTFKWSDNGGSTWAATGVSITGARTAQNLNNGVTFNFKEKYGHAAGDYWDFTAGIQHPLQINNDVGNALVTVKNSGKVGIGTNAPGSFLDVLGTSTQLRVSYDTGNYASFATNSSGNLEITAHKPASSYGDILLNAPNGNVGIGTASPGEKLVVAGGGLAVKGAVNTMGQNAAIMDYSSGNTRIVAGRVNGSVSDLVFYTAHEGGMSERARITYQGQMGINTTPSEMLDVNGNIKASGYVDVNGVRIISGAGNPNTNSVVANPGSLYLNTNGGAGATLWVKESGTGGSGWVAK